MKGIDRILDIIEAKIGKRDDFIIQDVIDFFQGDNIKIIKADEDNNYFGEINYYGYTGEYGKNKCSSERGFALGESNDYSGFNVIKGYYIILQPQYLIDKYGQEYYDEYCNYAEEVEYNDGWIRTKLIMCGTLDWVHIFEIDFDIPGNHYQIDHTRDYLFEEEYITRAFFTCAKLDSAEWTEEEIIKEKEDRKKYWAYAQEKDVLEYYGLK